MDLGQHGLEPEADVRPPTAETASPDRLKLRVLFAQAVSNPWPTPFRETPASVLCLKYLDMRLFNGGLRFSCPVDFSKDFFALRFPNVTLRVGVSVG
jgi:hypothetical protein